MSYEPGQDADFEGEELGRFGSRLKKGLKKVGSGFVKLHSKPTELVGRAIGGKKGAAIGRKIGRVAAFGAAAPIVAGAAPAVLSSPTAMTALTGAAIARRARGKGVFTKKPLIRGPLTRRASTRRPSPAEMPPGTAVQEGRLRLRVRDRSKSTASDKALARAVVKSLMAQIGPELSRTNKMLRTADTQRQASWEHRTITNTKAFRRHVLKMLAARAAAGCPDSTRTVRVLLGR